MACQYYILHQHKAIIVVASELRVLTDSCSLRQCEFSMSLGILYHQMPAVGCFQLHLSLAGYWCNSTDRQTQLRISFNTTALIFPR